MLIKEFLQVGNEKMKVELTIDQIKWLAELLDYLQNYKELESDEWRIRDEEMVEQIIPILCDVFDKKQL